MPGSDFVLRNRNGAARATRRVAVSVSPLVSIGVEKRERNTSADPNIPGLQKSRIARMSSSRFSTGVPVSATRCRAVSRRSDFAA